MDPNETLRRFRELYNNEETFADNLHLMVGLMADLDDWLTKGGALPKAWQWTTDDRVSIANVR